METLEQYTIYCTDEQTKKAIELGAQLSYFITEEESRKLIAIAKAKNEIKEYEEELNKYHQTIIGDRVYYIPTAEQMIGWLEEHEEIDEIAPIKLREGWVYDVYMRGERSDIASLIDTPYHTRPEATLAAIDAALDYLIEHKKG